MRQTEDDESTSLSCLMWGCNGSKAKRREREKEEEVEEELIQLIRRGLSSLNCSTPGGGSGGSGVGVGSEEGKGKEIIQGSFLSLLSLFVCALHCTALQV